MSAKEFKVKVLGGQEWDTVNDNIDVEVAFDDGSRFVATFFTIANIKSLFGKYESSGDCGRGTYVWADRMIIVKNLEMCTLRRTIEGLLHDSEFEAAFTLSDAP